jgi:hypothetical protein
MIIFVSSWMYSLLFEVGAYVDYSYGGRSRWMYLRHYSRGFLFSVSGTDKFICPFVRGGKSLGRGGGGNQKLLQYLVSPPPLSSLNLNLFRSLFLDLFIQCLVLAKYQIKI